MSGADVAHWARIADEWIAWARTPGHDAFWSYRAALAALIGPGGGAAALDVGCGEGRVSRLMGEIGWRVTACDPVAAFVAAAREAGSADAYAVAPAAALPFTDAAFDLVVAYNVLMDVEDIDAAARSIARVLRPGGRLVASVVHPLRDRGDFEDGRFVVTGDWFATAAFAGREERDGLGVDFAGWSRPLGAYVEALGDAGLGVVRLVEPRPDPVPPRLADALRLPIFAWLVAVPLPG